MKTFKARFGFNAFEYGCRQIEIIEELKINGVKCFLHKSYYNLLENRYIYSVSEASTGLRIPNSDSTRKRNAKNKAKECIAEQEKEKGISFAGIMEEVKKKWVAINF